MRLKSCVWTTEEKPHSFDRVARTQAIEVARIGTVFFMPALRGESRSMGKLPLRSFAMRHKARTMELTSLL